MDIILNLTRRCNLKCTYCRIPHDTVTMNESVAVKAIEMCFSEGKDHIIGFYGGEPLVEKDLMVAIVRKAKEMLPNGHSLRFNLTDNCTLLDKRTLNQLIRHRFSIAVSYDGAYQDMNRPFSDGGRSHEIVEENLMYIAKRRPKTVVMTTVSKESCIKLGETIEKIHSLGFSTVSLNLDAHEKDWDYDVLKKGLKRAEITAEGSGVEIIQFKGIADGLNGHGRSLCTAGYDDICVDTDGTLYPCVTFIGECDYSIDTVFDGIDEEKRRGLYRTSRIVPEMCIGCEYGRFCRRECLCRRFSSSGGIETFSKTECNIIKAWKEAYHLAHGK